MIPPMTIDKVGYGAGSRDFPETPNVLRVLIGKGDGGRRAFFFAEGRFIGNDTTDDSDSVTVVRAGNRSVALSYKLNGGGSSRVLFRWDGKKLAPQTAIPSSAQRHAT